MGILAMSLCSLHCIAIEHVANLATLGSITSCPALILTSTICYSTPVVPSQRRECICIAPDLPDALPRDCSAVSTRHRLAIQWWCICSTG